MHFRKRTFSSYEDNSFLKSITLKIFLRIAQDEVKKEFREKVLANYCKSTVGGKWHVCKSCFVFLPLGKKIYLRDEPGSSYGTCEGWGKF